MARRFRGFVDHHPSAISAQVVAKGWAEVPPDIATPKRDFLEAVSTIDE